MSKDTLTAKQEKFARHIAIDEMTAEAAYKAAGYAHIGAGPNSSALIRNNKVRKRILELRSKVADHQIVSALEWQDIVSEGARLPWFTAKGHANEQKMRCLEWLGQIHGLIGKPTNVTIDARTQQVLTQMSDAELVALAQSQLTPELARLAEPTDTYAETNEMSVQSNTEIDAQMHESSVIDSPISSPSA